MVQGRQQQDAGLHSGTVAPERVRAMIQQAAQDYHVIGAMSFGEVPIGHSVVLNVIQANPDPKTGGDVYDVGMGKYGLSGNFLNALADAAGVSTVSSRLVDYQVNYCVAEVTVARMGLDGRVRKNTARKIMDLRDGSGVVAAMLEAAKQKGKDGRVHLREQRLRIAEHADSKARLRAIRALLSVRTYTPAELRKCFAVFALQFTGRTNDPELRRIFAKGLMDASLGALTIFGPAQAEPAPMLAAGGVPIGLLGGGAPAPIADGIPDEDELSTGGDAAPPAPPTVTVGDPRRIKIPGKSGKMCSDAEGKDLDYWEKRLRGDYLSGKWAGDRYEESNTRQLLTMRAEMRRRGLAVETCVELDGAPAPAQAPAAKPPSGRGREAAPPTDDNPWGGEHSEHDRDDDPEGY